MVRTICVLLCVASVIGPTPIAAQTRDTVILRSGNPVIGEIQSLGRGTLDFDTAEMDVVSIDWDDIALLRSGAIFEVESASGVEYVGILASPDTALLVIVGLTRTDTLPFAAVVRIGPIEPGFWARTNGFVDLGTNIARANSLRSILVIGRFRFQGPTWGLEVNAESYWQSQTTTNEAGDSITSRTSRNSASVGVSRGFGAKWAAIGSSQIEHNKELQIERRLLAVLGGGYQIIRSHGLELFVGAGGSLNDEQFVGEPRSRTGELMVTVGFDAFDVSDVAVFANVTSYMNPTDGGRFRLNIDARIAWEIFNDFSVGLILTERYDSNPPSATAEQRDYQYSFTIGWSWS